MDIARLREFVTLASQLKLSSAAQELYMSPSTLSQHITAMERELGCELFTRTNGFELTAKGEAVLEHAQKILFEYESLQRLCAAPAQEGVVRLSIPNYHYLKQPFIETRGAFMESHPGCKVALSTNELQNDNPFDILESGASDVAALYIVRGCGYTIEDKLPAGVIALPLRPQRCVLVSSETHPLAGKPTLSAADLDGAVIIDKLCPVCSVIMDGISRVLGSYGAEVRVLFRRATRTGDVFLSDLDQAYVAWFEAIGETPDPNLPDLPVHRFEHELVADAYLLYRPDRLDDLQIAYLKAVSALCAQQR